MALAPDFQNTVQCGGRNAKPLCHGNVVLHGFVHLVAADNQYMATPQKFPRHINPVFMFGGNGIIEEMRQIEDGTDRGKTGQIDLAAVDRSLVGIGKFLTAPGGRNISKWFLHGVAPFSGFVPGGKQTAPCQE